MNWNALQNGSDIRGIALSLNKNEPVNLNKEVAEKIGAAFIIWLSDKIGKSSDKLCVGIGMDPRLSGPVIKSSIIKGATLLGCKVLDFGIATTPSMFMSTHFSGTNCDGSIMVTASHLPPNRNGMKFFTRNSGLEKQDIKSLLNIAARQDSNEPVKRFKPGRCVSKNILTLYSEYLINYIRERTGEIQPLSNLRIVVDAGNGSGGFFTKIILEPLGADTTGSRFLNPDGNFPNHVPNPEDKAAMDSIQQSVIDNNADLGIIFDTDVDRAAIVDHKGRQINRNTLIALLSAIVLEEHPGTYIVTDSVTSSGLGEFIKDKGGVHHRFQRGYKNVINEALKLNAEGRECWLAIETSGHGAMKENFFLDDGAFMVAKVLVKMANLKKSGKTISSCINSLQESLEAAEVRIKIEADNYQDYAQIVMDELQEYVANFPGWSLEKENYEGLRVNCQLENGNGWFLLRLSLHDPVLPLNIESNVKGGIKTIFNELSLFFQKFSHLKKISLT